MEPEEKALVIEGNSPVEENCVPDLGVLLVGHGTRKATGVQQLKRVFEQWSPLLDCAHAAHCFLELAEPTIDDGIRELAERGAHRVVVVPLLLFTAGHAEQDIPEAVNAAATRHDVQVVAQTTSLGLDPAILELSALRYRQAVCGVDVHSQPLVCQTADEKSGRCSPSRCSGEFCRQTAMAFVGRGSNSAAATVQMRRFSEERRNQTPVSWCQTCFLHGQSPTLSETLDAIEAKPGPLAVVQPHLLFDGLLMDELREQVRIRQQRQPARRWVLTDPLGTDDSLAKALAQIANAACDSVRGA